MSDIQPPPRRSLPPEVRGRIRARALARPRPRRRTWSPRAPFAVAAGVALLTAGAVIIGQSVSGGPGDAGQRTPPPSGTSSGGPQPLDVPRANAELDRCWAAIKAEGRAGQYPDRGRWRVVGTGGYMWVTVTTALADGKPIFCQTSVTTVRVSLPTDAPSYVPGTTTAALLISPEGIIAGVRDPAWTVMGLTVADIRSGPDLFPYNLFVGITRDRITDSTKIEVDSHPGDLERPPAPERFALPRAPAPVSRVDKPAPAKDRTSERGLWLKECLEKSASPVVDADMWEPGAMVDIEGNRYMVLRSGRDFAYCFKDGSQWGFGESVINVNDFGQNHPHMLPGPSNLEASKDKPFVTGALPDDIAKVQILQGEHPPIQADVWNDTYAAKLPEAPSQTTLVQAYDSAGKLLYEGSLY